MTPCALSRLPSSASVLLQRLAGCALVGWMLWAPPSARAQVPSCGQVLATLTVGSGTYQQVPVQAFEGRVYVYVPAIVSSGSGFQPFQMWVIEGVYGRPFTRPSGPLSGGEFNRLRSSPNVRSVPIRVARGDGSEAAPLRMGRTAYPVQVVSVTSRGKPGVQVRVCR